MAGNGIGLAEGGDFNASGLNAGGLSVKT